MKLEMMKNFLLWCSIINIGLLLWWFLFFALAHDFIYRMHTKWFKMPVEKFDAIHYTGIMFFKIFIFVANIVPFCALLIIT